MMITPLSNSYTPFYNNMQIRPESQQTGKLSGGSFSGEDNRTIYGRQLPGSIFPGEDSRATDGIQLPGRGSKDRKNTGIQDPGEECQTCKNRKYKDGSNEMVSFKSAQHVSPERAASAVRAHEQEHVSNAYKKAAKENGKVISASVSIHTEICPECGRSYVSGGTTHTQIKYYNEENPYQQDLKNADRTKYLGMNLDYAV